MSHPFQLFLPFFLFLSGLFIPQSHAETPPAATPKTTMKAKQIDEKITISNPTSFTIHVTVTGDSPEQESTKTQWGPIKPGDKGSGVLSVWSDGSMTVQAHWKTQAGKAVSSRPYTANFQPNTPITPVTLTLNIPYSSGSFGTWQSVIWEDPKN